MTDPLKTAIASAHAELDRMLVIATPWGFGSHEKIKCKSPPVIVWVEDGGDTKELEQNDDGYLFDSAARLSCLVWGVDSEQARKLYWNLQIACFRVFAENITFQAHAAPTETEPGQGYRGFVVESKATLVFHISDQPLMVSGYPAPLADYVTREVTKTTSTAELDSD